MVIVVISGVKLQLVLADVVDEPMLVVVELIRSCCLCLN